MQATCIFLQSSSSKYEILDNFKFNDLRDKSSNKLNQRLLSRKLNACSSYRIRLCSRESSDTGKDVDLDLKSNVT